MFAKLTGTIDSIHSNSVILDVNGVGYLISASSRTLDRIGSTGDRAGLLIETIVREDAINLFGFADAEEKEWFNLLCTVQGVGAKAALAILAVVSPEELPTVVAAEDKAAISRAEGIGPKLATRIVTELREKAGKMMMGHAASNTARTAGASTAPAGPSPSANPAMAANSDAVSALINLGYGRAEAFTAVTKISRDLGDNAGDVEILIRESLKELSA
ncbi:MAG: Holliday junction branch migration protein RuvA [Pseudomonadota bacterium]